MVMKAMQACTEAEFKSRLDLLRPGTRKYVNEVRAAFDGAIYNRYATSAGKRIGGTVETVNAADKKNKMRKMLYVSALEL